MIEQESDRPLLEAYKAYIHDVNELRASRLNETIVRVTVATLFLGAEAYIISQLLMKAPSIYLPDLDIVTWLPALALIGVYAGALALVTYIGRRFCTNWFRLNDDLTDAINVKFTNLRILEETSYDLRNAGATLFIEEYKQRHLDYQPPPLPNPATSPQELFQARFDELARQSEVKKVAQKPVKGAGLRARDLAGFFMGVFHLSFVLACVTIVLAGLVAVLLWLDIPGWIMRLF
jgi:hypothetical protein